MPIAALEDFTPRDFDAAGIGLGHAIGAQFPAGAGRSLAERVLELFTKVDEVSTVVNALPLDATVLAEVSELTIAAGVITVTTNYHSVDTEADAASDDLDTVSGTENGGIYLLRPSNDARSIVVKHGTGNIETVGGVDITLAEDDDLVFLVDVGTKLVAFASKVKAVQALRALAVPAATELTIDAGAITVTHGFHTIDTEADAASDNLDTISGLADGQAVLLRLENAGRNVIFRSGQDNIVAAGGVNIELDIVSDLVLAWRSGSSVICTPLSIATLGNAGLGRVLALTTNGNGASRIGIEDALGLITATTVENALAELVKYIPVPLADVGTGQAIPVTRSFSMAITQNGAETNTLAIPTFRGQIAEFWVDTDTSGARVITAAARINQANNTIITLTEVGDYIRLKAITIAGALRWQVVANDGAALS